MDTTKIPDRIAVTRSRRSIWSSRSCVRRVSSSGRSVRRLRMRVWALTGAYGKANTKTCPVVLGDFGVTAGRVSHPRRTCGDRHVALAVDSGNRIAAYRRAGSSPTGSFRCVRRTRGTGRWRRRRTRDLRRLTREHARTLLVLQSVLPVSAEMAHTAPTLSVPGAMMVGSRARRPSRDRACRCWSVAAQVLHRHVHHVRAWVMPARPVLATLRARANQLRLSKLRRQRPGSP